MLSNMQKVFFSIVLIFFVAGADALAQGSSSWGRSGEIESETIVIEKDKKVELPAAVRNYEKVPLLKIQAQKTKPEISFQPTSLPFTPVVPNVRIMALKEESLQKIYGNYVKAGFGNYTSPYLEGYFASKRSNQFNYGLRVKHHSFGTGPVDGRNSGESFNEIEASGRTIWRDLVVTGHAGYFRRGLRFYGYMPGQEPIPALDDIKQVIHLPKLGIGFTNKDRTKAFAYSYQADFSYLADRYQARELLFANSANIGYKASDRLGFSIDANVDVMQRSDESSINRNLFRIRPSLHFKEYGIDIKAGFNVVYENDTLDNAGYLHFYPYALASYRFLDKQTVYLQVDGDIERTSLQGFLMENPFLGPEVALFHSNKLFGIGGGLRGTLASVLSYEAGASFSRYRNLYFFQNSGMDSSRFEMVYDRGGTNLTNMFGSLSFQPGKKVSTMLRADYFIYQTTDIAEAWHRPEWKFSVMTKFNIYDKIHLGLDFYGLAGVKALNPSSNEVIDLPFMPDLNLKAEYIFSNRASAFLQGNNLLNNQYQRFLNYPVRGVYIMLGGSYIF